MGLPVKIEVHRFLASAIFSPPNTFSPFETCVCENIISKELKACYAWMVKTGEILKSNAYCGHLCCSMLLLFVRFFFF